MKMGNSLKAFNTYIRTTEKELTLGSATDLVPSRLVAEDTEGIEIVRAPEARYLNLSPQAKSAMPRASPPCSSFYLSQAADHIFCCYSVPSRAFYCQALHEMTNCSIGH